MDQRSFLSTTIRAASGVVSLRQSCGSRKSEEKHNNNDACRRRSPWPRPTRSMRGSRNRNRSMPRQAVSYHPARPQKSRCPCPHACPVSLESAPLISASTNLASHITSSDPASRPRPTRPKQKRVHATVELDSKQLISPLASTHTTPEHITSHLHFTFLHQHKNQLQHGRRPHQGVGGHPYPG